MVCYSLSDQRSVHMAQLPLQFLDAYYMSYNSQDCDGGSKSMDVMTIRQTHFILQTTDTLVFGYTSTRENIDTSSGYAFG